MRPSKKLVFMAIARLLSELATCKKRRVGCILTDANYHIVGHGYNGPPSGHPHCTEQDCGGGDKPTGSNTCRAVHAEVNALMNCMSVRTIYYCFTTTFPCLSCLKGLANTSCQVIIYEEETEETAEGLRRWRQAGLNAMQLIDFDQD
jgi:dCMP deaminase